MSRTRHRDPFAREAVEKKLDKTSVHRHERKERKQFLRQITKEEDLDTLDTEILFE